MQPSSPRTAFLGADISQDHIDVALRRRNPDHSLSALSAIRIANNKKGFIQLHTWLGKAGVFYDQQALLVIENTGVYHRPLLRWCHQQGLPIYVGNATELHHSFGIVRGKSDKADAERLCDYCVRCCDQLQASVALSDEVLQLKDLYAVRSRLLRQKSANRQHLAALKKTEPAAAYKMMETILGATLRGLELSIGKTEEAIKKLIAQNGALRDNYRLLLSVPGVGHVTAVYLICCTANFGLPAKSGKRLACYAGVAPFATQSGTSIRGRARVHPMANKELKKLLHQGARSVVVHKEEFRSYYQRKRAEGKHDLCVINAVKNKILLRVAAVINSGCKYSDRTPPAAA